MALAWTAAGLVAAVVVYFTIVALTVARGTDGIVTSRWGRAARLGGGMLRSLLRLLARTVRRWFTPAARRAELDRRFHEETARTILETMGNMKGVLMKLGQIISFMDEAMPAVYQEQLKKLQGQAPPMSYETVVRVLREELGKDPEALFAEFSEKPIASASIGQVHRARLYDGTAVAVKIQYPGVARAIAADLSNYGMLMTMVGAVTPTLDAKPIVEELRDRMLDELDYRKEAVNQEEFRALYAGRPEVVIPRVIADRSTERVLTMEFIEGKSFYDFVAQSTPEERRAAALIIHEFVFDSIWQHHIFNGDPHPGNYLFLPGPRVAFLDFGCVKRFDSTFIENFKALNRAYLSGDKDGYYKKAQEMSWILPGNEKKADKEWLWQYSSWFYAPIAKDEPFQFTAEYGREALAQVFGENTRKVNMPAEYVMFNRITFGLNSILSRLGARENWRRLSSRHYFPDGNDPGLTPTR